MATYQEIIDCSGDSTLQTKVRAAMAIASEVVRTELNTVTNHANRLLWAKQNYSPTDANVKAMLLVALVQSQIATPSVTKAQLLAATDAAVQSAVNSAIDVFATGG